MNLALGIFAFIALSLALIGLFGLAAFMAWDVFIAPPENLLVPLKWKIGIGVFLTVAAALVIIGLGGLVGILSGMFGVGGGFLTTPLLIFYGIPPTVATASASTQVTGSSVSGVIAYSRRKGVDYQMGGVLVVGGILGTFAGAALFRVLQQLGQIGQMDVLLVPIDGGYTLDLDGMVEVLKAIKAPLMIPMHMFSAYGLQRFVERVKKDFEIVESAVPTIVVARETLPIKQRVLVLPGR